MFHSCSKFSKFIIVIGADLKMLNNSELTKGDANVVRPLIICRAKFDNRQKYLRFAFVCSMSNDYMQLI